MSLENNNLAFKNQAPKIELFKKVFRGRDDVVPQLWVSSNGSKKGYSPICENKNISNKC